MDDVHEKNALEVPVNEIHGGRRQVRFPNKTGDAKSQIHVKYAAYQEYINKNYPDLHTFDIGINHELGQKREEMQRQLMNDYVLLNQLDIEQYEGLNSPDDIWDSLANSVYGMGFIGRYSRIAASLETGVNHIFTFEDFAHIYPFLKSCQGNAFLIRRLNDRKDVENKKFSSYNLFYKTQPEHSLGAANSPGVADVELERRSIYNHSLVLKPEYDNPPGTEWSYLSVDKDKVEMGNSYRRGYSYVPALSQVSPELDDSQRMGRVLGENTPSSEMPEDDELPELENEKVSANRSHDNRRYIYEKYLFCTYKWCPGSMRIILDCVHNVVILSMTNPHFGCYESHKRKIYDIVRKLFVLNHGDIDLIDAKYATIPRRYGLAFVESWIHSEEFENARLSEYTPSFLSYNIEESDQSKSWASQKNRNWVVDAFYNANSVPSKLSTAVKWQHKKGATHVKTKQDYVAHPQRLVDLKNYGIEYWNFDTFKYDLFGNVTPRSEWEFHVNQDSDEKNREIFRFWRKHYFGITDFVRQTSNHLSIGKNFELMRYFLAHNGEHTFDTSKVHIHSFDDQRHVKQQDQLRQDLLKALYLFTRKFSWEDFDSILFKQSSIASTLPNPDLYILPYPLNKQVQKLIETLGEAGLQEISGSQGCVFVCSSIEKIANSDKVVICEREIGYQDIILDEWRALHRRKNMIHPSDQIWNMEPSFIQALGMMAIYDKQYLKNRHVVDHFNRLGWKSINDERYFKTLGDALANERCKYCSPQNNRRRLPLKPIIEDNIRYVGFRIFYETNGKVETGYVFCNESNLSNSLKLIFKRRTKQEKVPLILLVDDTKCNSEQLQEIEGKVKIVQVRAILFGKLKTLIPFDYLLFLIRALVVEDVDMAIGEVLLRKRLPPQRKKDIEFYKLEFEGRRIASNAGLVRMAVQKLCMVNNYLKKYQDAWRIGKRWVPFELPPMASGEDKWKFLPRSLPKFDNLQLAKMLNEAGRNKINIQLAEDVQSIRVLEWAIECVNSEEQSNDCEELVSGVFRDFFELINRATDFV
ncbi:hypothetical protein PMKS-001225 [Pichia membranifaciens]|uniref:Uncharacterized protein n=1 Tax=Pichia membranifaciens TaxID=4926 RepID=A0A1Q2YDX3_9ASCO|nr:hypothetical protein PMKS-001225 [Pichia membranifaciens]